MCHCQFCFGHIWFLQFSFQTSASCSNTQSSSCFSILVSVLWGEVLANTMAQFPLIPPRIIFLLLPFLFWECFHTAIFLYSRIVALVFVFVASVSVARWSVVYCHGVRVRHGATVAIGFHLREFLKLSQQSCSLI